MYPMRHTPIFWSNLRQRRQFILPSLAQFTFVSSIAAVCVGGVPRHDDDALLMLTREASGRQAGRQHFVDKQANAYR